MIEKLNERITIEKSTVVTDKVGNHRNTWEEYFTCFAYASTYQAQEDEGEVTAEQKSVVFTVRWCSETRGLTSTGYRIRFREQLYNIESVDPMNYQKKILKIHCRLERRQPDEKKPMTVIAAMLLIPVPLRYKDGGSVCFKAVLYDVT